MGEREALTHADIYRLISAMCWFRATVESPLYLCKYSVSVIWNPGVEMLRVMQYFSTHQLKKTLIWGNGPRALAAAVGRGIFTSSYTIDFIILLSAVIRIGKAHCQQNLTRNSATSTYCCQNNWDTSFEPPSVTAALQRFVSCAFCNIYNQLQVNNSFI